MKLTRKQALDLLPSILDDEASDKERIAFFQFLENDDELKKQYESMKLIKELVKKRCPRKKAPDSLKNKIKDTLSDIQWEEKLSSRIDSAPNVLTVQPGDIKAEEKSTPGIVRRLFKPMRYVAAASIILFFSIITIELLDRTSTSQLPSYQSLEKVVFNHFENRDLDGVSLSAVSPSDIHHAAEYLEEELAHPLNMPLFDGADISQVLYTDFIPDFRSPVLEFHQPEIDEYIYVFVFKIDDLEEKSSIKRDPEAVEHCKTYDDYHIRDVNGKHVVSWKWGDYWYAAVSNHNGRDIIALVEPLDGEPSDYGW